MNAEQKARERAEELAKQYYIKTGFTADQSLMVQLITITLLEAYKEGQKEMKEKVATFVETKLLINQEICNAIA